MVLTNYCKILDSNITMDIEDGAPTVIETYNTEVSGRAVADDQTNDRACVE